MKCYAIGENKSRIETMSKEQIENFSDPVISSDIDLDVNRVLYLRLEPNISETVYNNVENPVRVALSFDMQESSPYYSGTYQRCYFRFNKSMGTTSKPSSFIKLPPDLHIPNMTIKYLNDDVNISNYTRIFLEVIVDNKTIYVRVDGC